ncbi:hepatic lectin-like [Dendrobates tinctorius]|uniref:hepatic lectin-like n=1 Tax=Dendrobates tinctorius TaxID=92724 RepID=UPI003CC9EEFC
MMDTLRSESMSSYFKKRPVIITYGLLALLFILVIALFVTVHYQNSKAEQRDLSRRDAMARVNITVNSLVEKLKTVEHEAKKNNTCDAGWDLFDSKCYLFSYIQSNWFGARSMCVLMRADLAVINNENEQKFISENTRDMTFWIGLTDTEAEGNWIWVDGTDYKSSYKNWELNEPNSYGGEEDCAQVRTDALWNDRDCHDSTPFSICEKKA